MFQTLLLKIITLITTLFAAIFPILAPHQISYQTVSSSTPQVNMEISTTTQVAAQEKGIATHVATTSTQKKIAEIPIPTKTPLPVLTTAELSTLFDQINILTRASLVNILCITQSAGPFSAASGSGVMVSSNGIIITNAHIAQYFLLKDFNNQKDFVQCTIRTGSPATATYKAQLIYISPTWIEENKKVLIEQNPQGTGEHDYAFLKIISHIDGTPVTDKIPFMPINVSENMHVGSNTLLASYPAGFLGGVSIQKDLYQSSAITQISKLFTFSDHTIDLISVPGTVVSQKGSSGGASVNENGQLIGIITTSSEADTTGGRDLRAITMAYINRDLISNAGTNLKTILEDSQSISDTFNQTIAATLTKVLTDSILNR